MLSKIWSVARNEYLASVRSKAFIVSIVLMPLIIVIAIVVQQWSAKGADRSDRVFAVIDRTGELWPAIERAAQQRDAAAEAQGDESQQARFVPKRVADDADQRELSEQVTRGELFAYVVIGKDVLATPAPMTNDALTGDNRDNSNAGKGNDPDTDNRAKSDANVAYHTNSPTYEALPNWLRGVITEEVRRLRYERAGVDPALIAQLNAPVRLRQMGLVETDAATGEAREAEERNPAADMLVPAGAMFLLFALVMLSCPPLLNTVLEEKMSRVAELLVSSVSPFELMLGKLVGAVMVTATLSVLYIGAVIYLLNHFELVGMVPVRMYFWFAFFLLLAVLMYGSIFIAIGAACSEIRDTQTLMTPAMLIIMLPVFTWFSVAQSPDSTFAVGASLFPLATPMLMLLRLGIPPGPPAWQVILAALLTLATTLLAVKAGAKIFRIGILSYGQAPTMRRLAGWVMSK